MAKQKIDTTSNDGVVVDINKKKKKSYLGLKITTFLILIGIIAYCFMAYAFNFFNLQQKVFDVFIRNDALYELKMVELENEKQKAQGEQKLGQEAKTAYENLVKDLESREKQIEDKEKQIEDRLKNLVSNGQANGDELTKFIAMFENMDAQVAARTLEGMDDIDAVANILLQMKNKQSAAIMAQFEQEFASRVAQRMMP